MGVQHPHGVWANPAQMHAAGLNRPMGAGGGAPDAAWAGLATGGDPMGGDPPGTSASRKRKVCLRPIPNPKPVARTFVDEHSPTQRAPHLQVPFPCLCRPKKFPAKSCAFPRPCFKRRLAACAGPRRHQRSVGASGFDDRSRARYAAPFHQPPHPGGNPGANLKAISHRCHPILVAFALG